MSKTKVKELEKEKWQYYKRWMREKTICKALGKEVKVTRKGWDHITHGTSSKYRNIADKINRLQILKYAKAIIINSKSAETNLENGVRYHILFQAIVVNGKKQLVKVLLKEDKQGKLIFYSVMKK